MRIVNPPPLASKVRILLSPPENKGFAGIVYWLLPWPSKPMRRVRFSLPAPGEKRRFAHLAQLVEYFLGKEEVGGSSPLVSSII